MPERPLRGHVTDYGDLLHVEQWLVKGRGLHWTWHLGPALDTTPADRTIHRDAFAPRPNERIDAVMDLQADKMCTLSPAWTDEIGNPAPGPLDAVIAYTVDDPAIINLIDNGDGTAVAAATGALGTANVHGVATTGGLTQEGDLQINVVAGLAERFNIAAGEPEEVTPDI